MPKALANRLLHIEVEGNFDSWKEWAIKSGVNDKVIGFLSFRRNYLMNFDAKQKTLHLVHHVHGRWLVIF